MQTVGFEPTRANTLRPERSTLDHSVIFASVCFSHLAYFNGTSDSSSFVLSVFAFILHIQNRQLHSNNQYRRIQSWLSWMTIHWMHKPMELFLYLHALQRTHIKEVKQEWYHRQGSIKTPANRSIHLTNKEDGNPHEIHQETQGEKSSSHFCLSSQRR